MVTTLGGSALAQTPSDDELADAPLPSHGLAIMSTAAPILEPFDRGVARRAGELKAWVEAFTRWQEWAAQWAGKRQPGWFTGFRDRRDKPEPPAWLLDRCAVAGDDESDLLLHACGLLVDWRDDYGTAQARLARDLARIEKTTKTVWWEHVHLDVLWPAMQWQSRIYGVVGMHTTTTIGRRLQVFITPGAMLLNVPSRDGGRTWKFATNYGIGFRLFDFTWPGQRRATLHGNLAKAWVLSGLADAVSGRTMDFAGFSLTFNRGG